MVKYDERFKQKVVDAYLAGEGGYRRIAKKFGVLSHANIRKWVNIYLKYGKKGLNRKYKYENYPVQFKIDVLNYKLRTGDLLLDIALNYYTSETPIIHLWHKIWQNQGIEGITKTKGRTTMNKKKKKKIDKKL